MYCMPFWRRPPVLTGGKITLIQALTWELKPWEEAGEDVLAGVRHGHSSKLRHHNTVLLQVLHIWVAPQEPAAVGHLAILNVKAMHHGHAIKPVGVATFNENKQSWRWYAIWICIHFSQQLISATLTRLLKKAFKMLPWLHPCLYHFNSYIVYTLHPEIQMKDKKRFTTVKENEIV